MMVSNTEGMAVKALDLAQQLELDLQQLALDLQNLALASEYQPGDTVQVSCIAGGYVTTSKTRLYFSIPLGKPVSDSVSKAAISGGTITVRGVGGYILGSADGGISATDLNITTAIHPGSLRVYITNSAGYDCTNNTPIGCDVLGVTITFS